MPRLPGHRKSLEGYTECVGECVPCCLSDRLDFELRCDLVWLFI